MLEIGCVCVCCNPMQPLVIYCLVKHVRELNYLQILVSSLV